MLLSVFLKEESLMPKQIGEQTPPTGIGRFFYRAPIMLYKTGLGWMMGKRFLLLNHVGRKSGLLRHAVIEVIGVDRDSDIHFITSGFGKQAQWYQNIVAQPEVMIQVGRRKLAVTAVFLSPEESGQRIVLYAKKYPIAAKNLMRLIGFEVDGSEEDYLILGRDYLPCIALIPR
jgi:deazaflavin-dependent oxidoreductase (nitroreductase family)